MTITQWNEWKQPNIKWQSKIQLLHWRSGFGVPLTSGNSDYRLIQRQWWFLCGEWWVWPPRDWMTSPQSPDVFGRLSPQGTPSQTKASATSSLGMAGQSIASLPSSSSSSRNGHHTLHQSKPGPTAPACALTKRLRRFTLPSTNHDRLTAKLVKQDDVAGSGTFSTDALDSHVCHMCSRRTYFPWSAQDASGKLPFLDVLWLMPVMLL